MKPIPLLLLFAIAFAAANAQTTREELLRDRHKLGSNYCVYPTDFKKRTAAPKGYVPFYISHYGRHGSRYHYSEDEWTSLNAILQKADSANALTSLGKSVLGRTRKLVQDGHLRAGDLTQKGAEQHRGIAKRMVESYPELFRKNARVDAYASTSGRCIVSMGAFCGELSALAPKLRIQMESSKRLMGFINYSEADTVDFYRAKPAWTEAYAKLYAQSVQPGAMMKRLFKDSAYVAKAIDANKFMRTFYAISSSVQGLDSIAFNFDDAWTDDEIIGNWEAQNAWWYGAYGTSPLTGSRSVQFAKNLLKDIIDKADAAIGCDKDAPVATLRFGHDTGILPLLGLLQVEGANAQVTDLTELYKSWTDFRLIPMAANLQLVFYRSAKKGSPVLVKALLNENEVSLPVQCPANGKCPKAPYYDWESFKAFAAEKIK